MTRVEKTKPEEEKKRPFPGDFDYRVTTRCCRLPTSGEFLVVEKVLVEDAKGVGKAYEWEVVNRVGNQMAAVAIATRGQAPKMELVLVQQFRPAADAFVLEFPAGLIDPGETPVETAIRELREETGCIGVPNHGYVFDDPPTQPCCSLPVYSIS